MQKQCNKKSTVFKQKIQIELKKTWIICLSILTFNFKYVSNCYKYVFMLCINNEITLNWPKLMDKNKIHATQDAKTLIVKLETKC